MERWRPCPSGWPCESPSRICLPVAAHAHIRRATAAPVDVLPSFLPLSFLFCIYSYLFAFLATFFFLSFLSTLHKNYFILWNSFYFPFLSISFVSFLYFYYPVLTRVWDPSNTYRRQFPRGCVKLATHLHLIPRSGMLELYHHSPHIATCHIA